MTRVDQTVPRDPCAPQAGLLDPAEPGASAPDAEDEPASITDEDPDVGLSQKGSGEDAVIRRETEV